MPSHREEEEQKNECGRRGERKANENLEGSRTLSPTAASPSHPFAVLYVHQASHMTRVHSPRRRVSGDPSNRTATGTPTEGEKDRPGAIKVRTLKALM